MKMYIFKKLFIALAGLCAIECSIQAKRSKEQPKEAPKEQSSKTTAVFGAAAETEGKLKMKTQTLASGEGSKAEGSYEQSLSQAASSETDYGFTASRFPILPENISLDF